mmetsp:Transcript_15875/g.53877  ORF Transcript_15875/g.53877 Transcript_15875/m.53877 type:complete len:224 (-) Transcript_15875:828-1499(-)
MCGQHPRLTPPSSTGQHMPDVMPMATHPVLSSHSASMRAAKSGTAAGVGTSLTLVTSRVATQKYMLLLELPDPKSLIAWILSHAPAGSTTAWMPAMMAFHCGSMALPLPSPVPPEASCTSAATMGYSSATYSGVRRSAVAGLMGITLMPCTKTKLSPNHVDAVTSRAPTTPDIMLAANTESYTESSAVECQYFLAPMISMDMRSLAHCSNSALPVAWPRRTMP